ncbi:hypothetical protein [Synechococcus sp. MIT S1220]|uniref:hypothetical protein n=1 Tax=Synechococcus sp. MIT S1220 TaxID=3082549 RepID=UPI0039B097EF
MRGMDEISGRGLGLFQGVGSLLKVTFHGRFEKLLCTFLSEAMALLRYAIVMSIRLN